MPFEYSECVRIYIDRNRTTLNEQNACIYNALLQSKHKGKYKDFIPKKKKVGTTKTSISERNEVLDFFNIGGEKLDKTGDTWTGHNGTP